MAEGKQFSIGEALGFGWKAFSGNIGFFILLTIVVIVVNLVVGFITGMVQQSAILSLLMTLISWIIQLFIALGMVKIALKFAGGGKGELSDLVSGFPMFLQYAIASILYGIAIGIGTVLLVIPGIIAAIMFMFYGYLIVEKGLGAIDALKKSAEITKGARWNLFLFLLVVIILNVIGAFLLMLGLIVTIPVTLVANAYIYRKLTV